MPWGSMAASMDMDKTAAEAVMSLRYQTSAYWETLLVRREAAWPTQRMTNLRFQCLIK